MKIKSLVIAMSFVAASGVASAGDYNAEAAAAPVDNGMFQSTIDGMNQVGGRYDTGLGPDWTKYVTIHGGLFTDAAFGSRQSLVGENNQRLSLTDGYVAVQATPNDWAKFDLTVNYSNADDNYGNATDNGDSVFVDQAYLTIGNEDHYPVFFQAGKQYAPFGHYDLFPISKSLGQVLTETNQTEVQVGFVVPKGLYGSVYTFQNDVPKDLGDSDPYNWGAALGFQQANEMMSFNAGVGYLANMTGVQSVQDYVNNEGAYSDNVAGAHAYGTEVDALAPYVSLKKGAFGLDLDYVSALTHFDKATLPYEVDSTSGAQPTAFDSKVSYNFNKHDMDQQVFVGYQTSSEASALDIPEHRYAAGYNVYPWKNVMVGFQVNRDSEYNDSTVGNYSNGDDYYSYNLRAGVQF